MVPAYKKKANLGIGGSILAVVLMFVYITAIAHPSPNASQNNGDPLVMVLMLISSGLFFWGLYNYAKSKGRTGWLALLGFLNLIGLIILVMLPNKLKK